MRKMITLIIALTMIINTTNAAFTETEASNNTYHTLLFTDKKAVAEFLVTLNRKDYEELIGRHLSLTERLAFKIAQKKLKQQVKRADEETEGFNLGGFALGLFLPVIGVLLAYTLSNDTNFRRWAWWGFRLGLLIIGIILIAALSGS